MKKIIVFDIDIDKCFPFDIYLAINGKTEAKMISIMKIIIALNIIFRSIYVSIQIINGYLNLFFISESPFCISCFGVSPTNISSIGIQAKLIK